MPVLLCLLGANWIGGLAAEFFGGGPLSLAMAQARASYAMLVIPEVAAALVSAIAVRYLLRSVFGYEISLGAAVAALLAGAVVRLGVQIPLDIAISRGNALGIRSAAALPVFFVLGPVGTLVSYAVLQYTRPLQSTGATEFSPYLDPYVGPRPDNDESAATLERTGYDECVDAVRETAAGLVDAATRAHRDEVADVVLRGLPYLEAATDALQRATPPRDVPPRLHTELTDAAKTVHEELLAVARAAAVGDDKRLRLADSEGMRRTRKALHELAEIGVATDW